MTPAFLFLESQLVKETCFDSAQHDRRHPERSRRVDLGIR
jgi:hypothetical protein